MKSIDDLADFSFRKFGSAEGSNSIFTFLHFVFPRIVWQDGFPKQLTEKGRKFTQDYTLALTQ